MASSQGAGTDLFSAACDRIWGNGIELQEDRVGLDTVEKVLH